MGELPERVTPRERALYKAFDAIQGLPDRHLDRVSALLRRQVVSVVAKETPALRDFVPEWFGPR